MTSDVTHLRAVLDRLNRLVGAKDWGVDLNPAQMAALSYLAQANRFSRSPSHVAGYLGATRGTMSQTLKALHRKGFLKEECAQDDKRRVSYQLSDAGQEILAQTVQDGEGLAVLDTKTRDQLTEVIGTVLTTLIALRGGASFGICNSCRFHEQTGGSRRCILLNVPLSKVEAGQVCHEHQPAI